MSTFKKFDVLDLVTRLNPDHHTPEPAYIFSNGRRYNQRRGIQQARPSEDSLTFGDEELSFGDEGLTF